MNTRRRLLALSFTAAAGLSLIAPAQAWSFGWGGGESVRGDGDVVSEAREIGAVEAVSLSGSFKVKVRQGGSGKLEIRADRNLLPYLETKVVDGSKGRTLEISTKRGYSLNGTVTPQIVVDVSQLRVLSIAGSGSVQVEPMQTTELKASVAGSGDIKLNELKAERLGISVSGSGDVLATGSAANLSVSVAGSGDVKTRQLVAEEAKVRIAGSGDVIVNASKKLDVSIAGSGDVGYVGNPELSTSTAGSGKIHRLSN